MIKSGNAELPVFSPGVITIDFRHSHSIESFKQSGIKLNDISSSSRQSFSYANQSLVIKLPAGRVIEQKVRLGIADAKGADLIQFTTTGVVMPQDEAYQVAKKIHLNLGLSTTKLDQWFEQEKNKGRNAKNFSWQNSEVYPVVAFSIRSSMNKLYPWVFGLKFDWGFRKHKDWDEERANRKNAPPPSRYATISLEPPSGKAYDRSDAYPEAQKYAKQVSAKRSGETGTKIDQDQLPKVSLPIAESKDKNLKSSVSFKWLYIVVGIALISILVILLRAAKRKGKGGETKSPSHREGRD